MQFYIAFMKVLKAIVTIFISFTLKFIEIQISDISCETSGIEMKA